MDMLEKRVIIADTDENFIGEMKAILEKNGYTVIKTVKDGIDAVSECRNMNPEIVFLKSDLNFVDGFKTAECLKEKGFSGLKIIVSDGYSKEISERAITCGADGTVIKPITEKFLVPWLTTKLARTDEKIGLFNEKKKLLSELENKRIESEAIGVIASSMKISIIQAKELLEQKAKEKNVSFVEVAKLISGKTE